MCRIARRLRTLFFRRVGVNVEILVLTSWESNIIP